MLSLFRNTPRSATSGSTPTPRRGLAIFFTLVLCFSSAGLLTLGTPSFAGATSSGPSGASTPSTPPVTFGNTISNFGGSGEPSIGADWKTGNVLMDYGSAYVAAVSFNDQFAPGSPGWATWNPVGPTDCQTTNAACLNLDPIMSVDSKTGRTLMGGDDGLCDLLQFTDNDGGTWTPTAMCTPIQEDHPSLGQGPAAPGQVYEPVNSTSSGATATYPDMVYECQDDTNGEGLPGCAASFDGGVTFANSVPMTACGATTAPGSMGHVRVGPTGLVFIPENQCGSFQGVQISTDNGQTFTGYPTNVPTTTIVGNNSDPAVAAGRGDVITGGRLYFTGSGPSANAQEHEWVDVSNDNGKSWAPAVDLNVASAQSSGAAVGVRAVAFPEVYAGDDNRAAVAFLGTKDAGNALANGFTGHWQLYIAFTYDGGQTWTSYLATPGQNVQGGCIDLANAGNCSQRNLLDFMDITMDSHGRVIVGYPQGCVVSCLGSASSGAYAAIARQESGNTLLSAYDSAAPPLSVSTTGPYAGTQGNQIEVTSTASSGTAPYSYTWTVLSAPAGSHGGAFANPNAATTSFVPDVAGAYTLEITVTDANGATATATTGLTASTVSTSGCQAGGVTIGTGNAGDSAAGPAGNALCFRMSDTSKSIDFYLDVEGKGVNSNIGGSTGSSILYNFLFSDKALGGSATPGYTPSPSPINLSLQQFSIQTTWDGSTLSTPTISSWEAGAVIQGETLSAEWLSPSTLHVSWSRSSPYAPAQGDSLIYLGAETSVSSTTANNIIANLPPNLDGTYTIGGAPSTAQAVRPYPTCGEVLATNGGSTSKQPEPGTGLRQFRAFGASDDSKTVTFCWTVADFNDRPLGADTDTTAQTAFNLFWTAGYQSPVSAYSADVVIDPSGKINSTDSGVSGGVCAEGICFTDNQPPVIGGNASSISVVGNTIEITLNKSLIGSPANGSQATGLQVDVRPYSDESTGQAVQDTMTPQPFTFGQLQTDTAPPAQVTGLAVSNTHTGTSLALSWTPATDQDGNVTSYNVLRSASQNGPFTVVDTPTTNATTDTGLTAGTTYWYEVSAVDGGGNVGPASVAVSGTPSSTSDSTPPSVPQNLAACGVSGSSVCLSWSASTDDTAVTGYNVYRNGGLVGTTADTTYTDTGLARSTTYTYTVSAVDTGALESAQSAPLQVTTLSTSGSAISITTPASGATATPPMNIGGSYSTTSSTLPATSPTLGAALSPATKTWATSSFVQANLHSTELATTIALVEALPGFLGAEPTAAGTIEVFLAGQAVPANAPSVSPTSHWPITYVTGAKAMPLVQKLSSGPAHAYTPQQLLADPGLTAAPMADVPGLQSGIGPGDLIQFQDNDTGAWYGCTASFLFQNPATGIYYLQTAGHCLLDETEGYTDSVTQPTHVAREVDLCISGCMGNANQGGIDSTWVKLTASGSYHPVAYAHQNGPGDDIGYIAIPPSLNTDLRPWMTFWSGPTGPEQSSGPGEGTLIVHYGHGEATDLPVIQGRALVATADDGNAWYGEGTVNPGDSGSSVETAAESTNGLTGDLAVGVATHLIAGVSIVNGQPEMIDAGTDYYHGLNMAIPYLGFTPVLVTQDEPISTGPGGGSGSLEATIASPTSGAQFASTQSIPVTGTAIFPATVVPSSQNAHLYMVEDASGATGCTNSHLSTSPVSGVAQCGSTVWEAAGVLETAGLGSTFGLPWTYPLEPTPAAPTYLDTTRDVHGTVYFICNGPCVSPATQVQVLLEYTDLAGTTHILGQETVSEAGNTSWVGCNPCAVGFSFKPTGNEIPAGDAPTIVLDVQDTTDFVSVAYGGTNPSSDVTLPLGTLADSSVQVSVDDSTFANPIVATGTTSWSAAIQGGTLAAGTHTIYARAVQGSNDQTPPASVSIDVTTASNTPPTASFTDSVSGLTASFTDTSTPGNSPIVSDSWNFGDGSPASTATNPTHTYSAAGTYSVALTVTDQNGLASTATQSVTVSTTATNSWSIQLSITNAAGNSVLAPTTVATPADGTSSTWGYYFDQSLPGGQTYTIHAALLENGATASSTQSTFTVPSGSPAVSVTSPTNGSTATPPLTIAGAYDHLPSSGGSLATSPALALPPTTANWVSNAFVANTLRSTEYAATVKELQVLPGFLAAYPTTTGAIEVLLTGALPSGAPMHSASGSWSLMYSTNVNPTPLVQKLSGPSGKRLTPAQILANPTAAPTGPDTIGLQGGIGPGDLFQVRDSISGSYYGCTASFLFQDPTTHIYYLETAGHCLLDVPEGGTDSVAQPDHVVNEVDLCIQDCMGNFFQGGVPPLTTFLVLTPNATYNPVAFAHQNGIGDDAGFIEIPPELNSYLRPWMWLWSGPTGPETTTAAGNLLVHYGHGVNTDFTFPTQGRAAIDITGTPADVGGSTPGNYFAAAGMISGGDSGSSIEQGIADPARGITGGAARGIVTHEIGTDVAVLSTPGVLFFGTDYLHALSMLQGEVGLNLQLVTQDQSIELVNGGGSIPLVASITTPNPGALFRASDPIQVSGTATFPPIVQSGTATEHLYLVEDATGTNSCTNPHLSYSDVSGVSGCAQLTESALGAATSFPQEPAATSPTYLDQSRNVTGTIYFVCFNGAPCANAVTQVTVTLSMVDSGGVPTTIGSETNTYTADPSWAGCTACAVKYSFRPGLSIIPVGSTVELTVNVQQTEDVIFTEYGGSNPSDLILPLGTPASQSVQVSVDDASFGASHLVPTTGSTSWSASIPGNTFAALSSHVIYARAVDGAQTQSSTPAHVAFSIAAHTSPTASFTTAVSDLTATFTDTSTPGDSAIQSVAWNFGDSTTSTATNPVHTYAAAGTYTVTLTVTDANGLTGTASHTTTVTAPVWSIQVSATNATGATVLAPTTVKSFDSGTSGTWQYFWGQQVAGNAAYTIHATLLQYGSPVATGTTNFTTPAGVATLVISPASATVPAGGSQTFTATYAGNSVTPNWYASCGAITAGGVFTAPTGAGVTCTVSATYGSVSSNTASVSVVSGSLASMTISPGSATLPAGATQQYTALGYDQYGNAVAVTPTWSATCGAIDASGLFTAPTAAAKTCDIVASSGSVNSNTAIVSTVAGPLAQVLVGPTGASVPVTTSKAFTAQGVDQYGNAVTLAGPITWTTSAGSITSAGVFTAPTTVGTDTITATDSATGISGSQTVTVVAGKLVSIGVSPSTTTVGAGKTVSFTATGADAYGNPVTLTSVKWGMTSGTISQTGVLTAPTTVGSGTVVADANGYTASASFTVVPGPIAKVVLVPNCTGCTASAATIAAGQIYSIQARGADQYGNDLGPLSATWTSTIGSIDASGTFTAPTTVGTGSITATDSASGLSANEAVTVVAGPLDHIVVSPGTTTVSAGNWVAFSAAGFDAYNNVVAIRPTFTAPAGTLVGSNYHAPTTVGSYVVTASAGAKSGTSTVNVVAGPLAKVAVSGPSSVQVTGAAAYTASGADQYGNAVPVFVTWSAPNGLGTIGSDGTFVAGTKTGTATVTATSGSVKGSLSIQVTPGPLASFTLSPGTATTNLGEPLQFVATGYDAYNNVIPGFVPSYATTLGSISASGVYTSSATGTADVNATAGALSQTAQVTVVNTLTVTITMDSTYSASQVATQGIHGTVHVTYADGKAASGSNVLVSIGNAVLSAALGPDQVSGTTGADGSFVFSVPSKDTSTGIYQVSALAGIAQNSGSGSAMYTVLPP
ncbi:MAG: PKD domain-containing protein [Thermoplasmatota archaeon]